MPGAKGKLEAVLTLKINEMLEGMGELTKSNLHEVCFILLLI